MTARRARSAMVVAALVCATLGSTPAAQAATAVEPPPSADEFVTTTNALMRPADVPASLAATGSWSVSYMIPPGGQDPIPLCTSSLNRSVPLSPAGAVNYSAGTYGGVIQSVYAYDTPARAAAAWRRADAQLKDGCSGSYSVDGTRTTVTSGRLPASNGERRGWWVRTDQSDRDGSGSYLTAVPVGDSIQVLYYFSTKPMISPRQRAGMDRLSAVLARRLAAAPSAPVTQDPLLTTAQRSMMQPSDVPADLPYTRPADGGWSAFLSYEPGEGPWTCGASSLPKGVASFETAFGGDGGPIALPGSVDQRVEVYADRARAQAAWQRLSAGVLGCAEGTPGPLSTTTSISRTTSGTSPLVVDGTAGVWSRELDTFTGDGATCTDDSGATVPCEEFTAKSYSISLLVGQAIQTVTYSATVDGIRQVPLDQVSVNALAEQLARRWLAVSPTG